MTPRLFRRLAIIISCVVVVAWIGSLVKKSIPYSDRDDILSASIMIDSIWSMGPTATIYDKHSRTSYWMKSHASTAYPNYDLLKSKKANIRYIKFFHGPLENKIVWMKIDSVVVIDQIVDK